MQELANQKMPSDKLVLSVFLLTPYFQMCSTGSGCSVMQNARGYRNVEGKEHRCDRLDRNNNSLHLQQVCSPQLMAAMLFRFHNRKVLVTPFSSTDLLGKQSYEVLLHKIDEVQCGKMLNGQLICHESYFFL